MKLACFLMLHKNAGQFAWIFSAVYNPDDLFLIHVDARSAASFLKEVQAVVGGRPNVRFLDSIPVSWGGWSQCEAEFRAIRHLIASGEPWDYLVNLSGQDYPLRPLSELKAFLAERQGTNFIRTRTLAGNPLHFRLRLLFRCIERDGRMRRLPIPNWPFRPLRIRWFGSSWHFLSRDFCEWLATSGMMECCDRALRHTKAPDEFVMQAAAMNGPFRDTVDPGLYRFYNFDGPSPVILTEADWDDMTASDAFFARKFDESVDRAVLERLAGRIGAPIPHPLSPAAPALPAAAVA
jgi:hypothetical protein